MKKILFVCTGNRYRSVSAKFLFEKYLEDNNIDEYISDSAGTIAISDEELRDLSIRELGYDYKPFEEKIHNKILELGKDINFHIPKK